MNGFGKQLENFGRVGENVERILDAIRFQTAILTLNAALEAAHAPETGKGSAAFAGQVRNVFEQIAKRAARDGSAITSSTRNPTSQPP